MVPSTWIENIRKKHILGETQQFIFGMLEKENV